mgnify:CR=1 FL=1
MQNAYTVEQIKNRLRPVFYRNQVKKAVLFGSYSKGTATPQSDVDIWVDSGMHGLSFFGLLEDVCQAMECPVDLIDKIDVVPGSRVDQEISRTGVVIYEQ